MKEFLFVFLCITFLNNAFSQALLKATLKSTSNNPLENANVYLLNATDSNLLKTTVSDSSGRFMFGNLKNGIYLLKLTSSFFNDTLIRVDLKKDIKASITILLPTITKHKLEDVVVKSSQRKLIEVKVDRIIFDPSQLISSAGSNAYELLNKAPSVTADEDGSILMRGIAGVGIMINGRILRISGDQIMGYLRSIPADQVDKIEIINNPSAKYDAEGTAGLINIILKKSKLFGLNGTISPSFEQNKKANFGNSLNVNYRTKKVDLSLGSSVLSGRRFTVEQVDNIYSKNSNPYYYYETGDKLRTNTEVFNRVSADITLDKNNTLGFKLENSSTSRKGSEVNNASFSSNNINADSIYQSQISLRNHDNTFSANINYNRTLDTTGQSLSFDIDYLNYSQPNLSTGVETNRFDRFQPSMSSPITFSNAANQYINLYSVKSDYSKPISQSTFFEFGLKYDQINTDSRYFFYNSLQTGHDPDFLKSNTFYYKERNAAAYSNLYTQLSKKLSSQFGLRFERTRATGTSASSSTQLINRNYTRFFPTIFLQYKLNEINQFVLSFSKRINRPNFSSLSPFRYYSTPNSYIEGNPFLQPSLSNSFDLTYTYKQKFYFNFFVHLTDLSITQIPLLVDSIKAYRYEWVNISNAYNYGIFSYLPFQVFKFWQSQLSLTLNLNGVRSNVEGSDYKYKNFNGQIQLNNNFSFATLPRFSAEVNFRYQPSGMSQGLFQLGRMADLSVGLKKVFKDNRSTLTLNFLDLLNTSYVTATVNTKDQYSFTHGNYYKRGLRLTFSYLFGKTTIKSKEQKQSNIQEEKQRVK